MELSRLLSKGRYPDDCDELRLARLMERSIIIPYDLQEYMHLIFTIIRYRAKPRAGKQIY